MFEKSHISIQVGPRFEGNGKWYTKANADVTQQAAKAQLESLRQQLQGNLDLEWSVVLKLSALPGKATELESALKNICQAWLLDDDLILKTHIVGDTLWMSIKLVPDNEADFVEPFNMFFAQGLDNVAQNQENKISLDIRSNFSFEQVVEAIKNKERIISILMKNINILLQFQLNKDLAQSIRNLIENFDPDLSNDPINILILKFKNFNIDLEFISSEEVPEIVKLKGFFGKKINQAIEDGDGGLKKSKQLGIDISKAIDSQVEFYFTIPDFAAVKAECNLPGLSEIMIEYSRAIGYQF